MTSSSSNNMYRVGDFVYVDQGPHVPYGVRRIDELQKSASGNVDMEVMIYLRRMDVNKEVLPTADENLKEFWDEMSKKYPTQVQEREVFLSKQTETVSATQIRGKWSINDSNVIAINNGFITITINVRKVQCCVATQG